ncbi:hypothetical protein BDW75DRAFT_19513 [Aspergillus navahoensis]
MYASALVLASLLAAPALATNQMLAPFKGTGLSKRQGGESFQPPTTPGCPDDWPMCGTSGVCYSPARGDTCCPDGTWACPVGSFCLQDGYCCPEGLDPQTCAEQNGITLTSDEPTSSTTSSSTSTSSTPVIPTTSETTATNTPTSTPTSSSAVPPTTTTSPPEFTGAANAQAVGGAAAILGGLGLIGNLLI